MSEEDIPLDIRQFIRANLRSVEQLDILLLVGKDRDIFWTVQSVYDVIVSSKPSIEYRLEEFVRLGFCEKTTTIPPTFRYVATGEIAARIEALARLYKTKPVRVIEAIFKKDQDPVQSFADAFKFKKRP